MLEQALLREQVQAILAQERQAEKAYTDLVAKITDAAALEELQALLSDKQRHIRLAERLLEILD